MWRKTHTPRHRADSMDLDTAADDDDDDQHQHRSSSSFVHPPSKNDYSAVPPPKLRSALNLYSLLSESEKASNPRPKDMRVMRFSSTVHICLIPSRDELQQQMAELFWKPDDYVMFKRNAVQELRLYLLANGITAKEAIFQLYQPHDRERAQWMKEFGKSMTRYHQSPRSSGEKESETDRESSSTVNDYCSEDDDEPRYGRQDADGFKFFTNIKTDIELNAEADHGNGDGSGSGVEHKGTHLPTKTPNAGHGQGQVWAVQWKPQQAPAEHK